MKKLLFTSLIVTLILIPSITYSSTKYDPNDRYWELDIYTFVKTVTGLDLLYYKPVKKKLVKDSFMKDVARYYRKEQIVYYKKDVDQYVMAHEITHYLLNQYFCVNIMPEKMQEIVCGYVEYKLRKEYE